MRQIPRASSARPLTVSCIASDTANLTRCKPNAGGMIHFDTSYWALSKLADPKYGAVGVNYRVVSPACV